MRAVQLARVAAQAETLRLRAMTHRLLGSALTGVVALLFLAAGLVFAHLAAWFGLRGGLGWSEAWSAAALMAGDLVVAAGLGVVAVRSQPGRAEIEAVAIRQAATDGITHSLTLPSLALTLARLWPLLHRDKPSGEGADKGGD